MRDSTYKPPRRRPRKLPRAEHITDFRPGLDRMMRLTPATAPDYNLPADLAWLESVCWVVDTRHEFAPLPVQDDRMDADLREQFKQNYLAHDQKQRRLMLQVIRQTAFLTEEGRAERLQLIEEVTVVPEMARATPQIEEALREEEERKRQESTNREP